MTTQRLHTVKIFCTYAHKDKNLQEQLFMHLSGLQRTGLIQLWSDSPIRAGQTWESEIDSHLDTADIVLLLVSPDFLASEDLTVLRKAAIERHINNETVVIPIILRLCQWRDTSLGDLNVWPTAGRPITEQPDIDEAFCNIAQQLRYHVENRLINGWRDEGSSLYTHGKMEEALQIYDQILRLDPKNRAAKVSKGIILCDLQQYEEALELYERGFQSRSQSFRSSKEEDIIKDQQMYEVAASVYRQMFRQDSSYESLGKNLLEKVPPDMLDEDAFTFLNRALRHDPTNPFLYYIKGNVYTQLEKYQEALGAYEQAIHLKHDLEPALTRFSKTMKQISKQEYQKLYVLARQTREKANLIRDRHTPDEKL
jgi:tetratricopeptide (TPR) repeat protein